MGAESPVFELSEESLAFAREIAAAYPYEARRADPRFPDICRRVVGNWCGRGKDSAEGPPLRDISRFAAASMAVYLEETPGGLTLARMRALIERPGFGGIGHGRAVLIYLRYIGHIAPLPREGDGRVQRYTVTSRTRDMLRVRYRREFEALTQWEPVALAMLDRMDDEEAFTRLMVCLGEDVVAVLRNDPTPENPVGILSSRAGGMIVFCTLLQAAEPDDTFPPRKSMAYNIAELSRLCHASRMQVRHLLNRARDTGLLVFEDDGRVRLSEELALGLERLVVSVTWLLLHSAGRSLKA